ncbi:putative ATPase [Xanthomonas arboricola]|uniref:AAA family ATPase n=1 Tax=Xanthomonas arboricola TaxID=56448 RepID=UPI00160AF4C8|nr:AAA family ATPase [Xanthomonas arboricola]MBB6255583.1 putative ATPase [Xanthomonas arboricola]
MEELSTTSDERSRITKVFVEGLFGLYDHTIELNQADQITIVHGPNGVGKTVLLKAIAAFFAGNYSLLSTTPFNRLTVWINNAEHVVIARVPSGKKRSQPHFAIEVTLPLFNVPEIPVLYRIELPEEYSHFASSISRHIPGLQQIGPEEFFDSRLSMSLDAEQVIWRYADHPATPAVFRKRISAMEPIEVRKFRQRIHVQMIETNRLYKVASNEIEFATSAQLKDRITDYATQLRDRIQQTLADYGRNAQKLDQTFPHRLISEEILPLGVDALKRSIKDLDDTQKALAEFGLLERLATIPFADDESEIEQSKLVALTLFTRDIKEKIAVLSPLSNRIKIFLNSINSKLRNKKIYINKESGLIAKDALGTLLPLEDLSSGEQHEIVLAFELVFNMPKNSLVLLDEPELSLHVTWQRMFLPELMNISNEVGFDCIIATHSPFIVGARTDLLVLLDADPDVDLPKDSRDSISYSSEN